MSEQPKALELADWATGVADQQELIHLLSWVELRNGIRGCADLLRTQHAELEALRKEVEQLKEALRVQLARRVVRHVFGETDGTDTRADL